ncbi:Fic family protein [Leucobacter chromiiresistens]|uniref:Fic family protein n=1 Tax=Leucobacter chromiiresistens TaxID=1079994 RepID=A0A1H0Y770_9MICO|nr:Fic family protein [Leucobacter chromiiresistens]SDQ10913.1 Fic family protein [Leucobacter chromiiresistens]
MKQDGERFFRVFTMSDLDDSRYMHWDEISRRTPPRDLTHEEWWVALKISRLAQSRRLPLHAKNGSAFTVNLTDEVLQLSEEIARRAGGTVGGAKNDLNRTGADTYLVRSLLEESIRSSQLEGASTTRRVAVEMIDSGREPQDVSETMILNNYVAMQEAKTESSSPLTPELVLDLHRTLTQNTLEDPDGSGRLQTPSDERVSVWAGDVCVHVPPPAEELPERLQKLSEFANGTPEDSPYLPPVVRAIITHFMFGYDHYFEDGNGRTARAAFYWSMLHNDYWLAEYATISEILRKAPGKHGDAYEHSEDDDGDLTYFVLHQLRVFKRALDRLDTHIETRRAETSRLQRALTGAAEQFNFRQGEILESLSSQEYTAVSAATVANRFHVTEQTGRNDLRHLERLGLLFRLPKSRPALWVASGDLAARIDKLDPGTGQ